LVGFYSKDLRREGVAERELTKETSQRKKGQ
jgi:hypothetical protein